MPTKYARRNNLVLVDFRKQKLRNGAREYVECYLKYGSECASFWSIDRVKKEEKKQFRKLVRDEMRKRGLDG